MNATLKRYLHIQILWAKIWVISVFVIIIVQIVYQDFKVQDPIIPFITIILKLYIPSAIILLFAQFIFSKYRYPSLYLYYHIWINNVYRFFQDIDATKKGILNQFARIVIEKWFNPNDKKQNRNNLILESFPKNILNYLSDTTKKDYPTFVKLLSLGNRPVVVRRKDLLEKSFLKNWAFVSVLYFKPIKILKPTPQKSRLIIDIRDESCGIYNNAGKLFLELHYLTRKSVPNLVDQSKKLESYISSDKLGEKEFQFNIPFRWTSGGILPIAQYKEKEWFVLFSRDINPVGLNIANGASENKEEYKNLFKLMYREFGEELILLDREPEWNDPRVVKQKLFRYLSEQQDRLIKQEEFANEHQEMRRLHDEISIEYCNGPEIEHIKTPFEVQISYYDDNLKESTNTIQNIIFNVNPTEFGIDICYIAKFKMEDDDYLLDGEIWNDELLVRQPVMLISCDFIRELFEQNQSIGIPCMSEDCKDCRTLERIPCSEYVLFNADLVFRKKRLDKLVASGSGESIEAKRIRGWLDRHEKMFEKIDPSKTELNSQDHPYLTRLCPVTWKTFEKLCYHNLIPK
jgi:hypothetical protein